MQHLPWPAAGGVLSCHRRVSRGRHRYCCWFGAEVVGGRGVWTMTPAPAMRMTGGRAC